MSAILETDETGSLKVPANVLPIAAPNTAYSASLANGTLLLTPLAPADARPTASLWHQRTPAERAAAFLEWAKSHKVGPGLPDWAVSRDSIYD